MKEAKLPEIDPRFVFVAFDTATTPPDDIIQHFKDRWWVVHPDKGIVYWKHNENHMSPLCNRTEELAKRICASMCGPWAEVKFFPSVFRRIRPQDFCGH